MCPLWIVSTPTTEIKPPVPLISELSCKTTRYVLSPKKPVALNPSIIGKSSAARTIPSAARAIHLPLWDVWDAHMSIYAHAHSSRIASVSYTHLRAHETDSYLVCRLLLEKKKKKSNI